MDHPNWQEPKPTTVGRLDPVIPIAVVLVVLSLSVGWFFGRPSGANPTERAQVVGADAGAGADAGSGADADADADQTSTTGLAVAPQPTTTRPWGSATVSSGPTELAPPLSNNEELRLGQVAEQANVALYEISVPACGEGMRGSQGTGWAIDRFHLVTNAHVVSFGNDVVLSTREGRSRTGQVIGRFDDVDVAVIRVSDPFPHSLSWAQPGSFDTGDGVVVVGWPNNSWRATTGVIQHVESKGGSIESVLTDAAVDHGNSGGPVLDSTGRVVGILTFSVSIPNRPDLGLLGLAYTEQQHGPAIRQAISSPSIPEPDCSLSGA